MRITRSSISVLLVIEAIVRVPGSAPQPQAQSPVQAGVLKSEFGYAFRYPAGWTPAPNEPKPRENSKSSAWRLSECTQTELTLRGTGSPPAKAVVTAIPYECTQRSWSEKDFPGFVILTSRSLKRFYEVRERGFVGYTLGTHDMWVERLEGTPKEHPESPTTLELACTLLKKAAVCWMAEGDEVTLKEFEHCTVAFESESPLALVPAPSAAQLQKQKPSSKQRPDTSWSEIQAAPTGNAVLLKSDLGFTFNYPVGWDDITAVLPLRINKQQKEWNGSLLARTTACIRPVLLVQHGKPGSTISVLAAPHSCTSFQESNFAFAASLGMCSNDPDRYDIKETRQTFYRLGSANLFLERSTATPKDQPGTSVTLERVCGWLKNSEVFWQGELRDDEAVDAFEGALTSIDGEMPSPLVPPSAKDKLHKPTILPKRVPLSNSQSNRNPQNDSPNPK